MVIRVGLVGCGRIVRIGHVPALRALQPSVDVVAVADPTVCERDRVAELWGVPMERRYASVDELIAAGGVDVVDIGVPNAFHRATVTAAAQAGIAVLVEKPMATTLADALTVAADVRASGVRLAVAHNRLFDPVFAAAIRLVAEGAIGRVHTVRLESLSPGFWPGTPGYDPSWRSRRSVAGGGALLDNGYHSIYLAEALTGSRISRVSATVTATNADAEVDDLAVVVCHHDSGAMSVVEVGWAAPGGGIPADEVHGTEGTISFGRDGHPLGLYRSASASWTYPEVAGDDEWGFGGLFTVVLPFLAGERTDDGGAGLDAGLHVQAVLDAAYRSARAGRAEAVVCGTPPADLATAVSVDDWDALHLLLSVDERARPERDQAALDAVIARVAGALARLPSPDVSAPALPAPSGGGALVEQVPEWIMETNSWILAPDGDGGPCLLVDVPPHPRRLIDRLAARRLRVEAVVLTHGHLDHVGGVAELLAALPAQPLVPVHVHAADLDRVLHPVRYAGALRAYVAGTVDEPPPWRVVAHRDGDAVEAAGVVLETRHTPGHTPGSSCFVGRVGSSVLTFTGDVLFSEGIGRTDLSGASARRLDVSLRRQLERLPETALVLPGHGTWTTAAEARAALDQDRTRRATAADASASLASASRPPLATASRTQ